jgi:hypothetical protein
MKLLRALVIGIALAVVGYTQPGYAVSTVNPTVPAANSPLSSAVVRNNFAATTNDINNLLGKFAGPVAPVNQTALQDWADTSAGSVYSFKFWNPTTGTWVKWGSLNTATGIFSVTVTSGSFAATPPITLNLSGGVATYGIALDSNFAVSSGSLAFSPAPAGDLLANCTASPAEPGQCTWNSFANQAISNSNGALPYRTGGTWGSVSTGVIGNTIPLNNTANVFSAAQSIITNLAAFPTPDTGALLSLGNLDGVVTRVELTSAGSSSVVSGRTSLGTLAAPTTLINGTLMMSYNAHGYDGTSWATAASGAVHVYAEGTWSNTSHPTEVCDATTPIGSTTIVDVLCTHNDGGVTVGSPTGGDKGAGSINVGSAFVNGVAVSAGSTINSGLVNQLAWYATSGTTLSGLFTFGNGVLVTSGSGIPSISTTLPSGLAATNMALTTPTLGVASGTSLALGGATIGSNALAVTGAATVSASLVVGSTLSVGGTAINLGNGAASTALAIGQDTTHYVTLNWSFNALPASASAQLATSGYSNPLTIDASNISIQGLSGGTLSLLGRTVVLGGNVSMAGSFSTAGAFTQTGAFSTTLTVTATTNSTLPAGTHTLVGQDTTDTLTNKTLTSSTNVLGGVTMTLGSDATGDIYYRAAGGLLTRLPIGSSTNVLTVSAGLPAWVAPGTGGTVTSVVCGTATITTTGTCALPYFSAHASTTTTLTSSTTTKVQINTKDSDSNTWFDATTNFRFTPQLAGRYRVHFAISCSGTTVQFCISSIEKNSTNTYQAQLSGGGSTSTGSSVEAVIQFNGSTDFVEFFATIVCTGTCQYVGGTAPIQTFADADFISP